MSLTKEEKRQIRIQKEIQKEKEMKSLMIESNKIPIQIMKINELYLGVIQGEIGVDYDGNYHSYDVCFIQKLQKAYEIFPIFPSTYSQYSSTTVKHKIIFKLPLKEVYTTHLKKIPRVFLRNIKKSERDDDDDE